VLFQDGRFQWRRLENLLSLAQQGGGGGGGLDLSDTVASGARVVLADDRLRTQLLLALTEDNRLHFDVRARPARPAHAAWLRQARTRPLAHSTRESIDAVLQLGLLRLSALQQKRFQETVPKNRMCATCMLARARGATGSSQTVSGACRRWRVWRP
jgi:hypothetical protein